jgi:hypothetical protein
VEQLPPVQVLQLDRVEEGDAPLELTEKVLKSLVTLLPVHEGHATRSSSDRMSTSNTDRQSRHEYS